jgi:NAD+ kinase
VRRTITSKSNASTNSSLSLRRVLILSKQTRYETEVSGLERATSSPRAQATDPTKKNTSKKQELEREISRRGLNFDRLHQSYDSHVRALETIEKDLERHNIEYQVVTATRSGESDFPESYQNYDAIISAGGDGTFLKAASEMYTSEIPLIGVNTDPNHSKGALCTVDSSANFRRCLEQMQHGAFDWRTHSRLRVQLEETKQSGVNRETLEWTQLKQVALNEIFFAERNVAHPIQHELIVDQDAGSADVQLSSGILICTGTGSSAWMANALNVDTDTVRQILDMTRTVVGDTSLSNNIEIDNQTMDRVADALNQQSHFDVGSDHIKYFVREVVSNGLRPPCRNRQGRHKSVTIRSRGWDPTMTLDGIHTYPLPAGQRAHFDTDPSVALRTCRFE